MKQVDAREQFDYADDEWRITLFGQKGFITQIGDKIQCHICGQAFHSLGKHINAKHGLNAHGYRSAFHLHGARTHPLASAKQRERMAIINGEQLRYLRPVLTDETFARIRAAAVATMRERSGWLHRVGAMADARRNNIRKAIEQCPRGPDGRCKKITAVTTS